MEIELENPEINSGLLNALPPIENIPEPLGPTLWPLYGFELMDDALILSLAQNINNNV